MNCCLFDVKSVLTGGFEMGNIWYNEPKTLDVAFDVIGDIVLSAASQQYGGFTVPNVEAMKEALLKLGFWDVEETAVGAEMVSDQYAALMKEKKHGVLISSCCPSINMLIEKYYPTMLGYLAGVLTPMEGRELIRAAGADIDPAVIPPAPVVIQPTVTLKPGGAS